MTARGYLPRIALTKLGNRRRRHATQRAKVSEGASFGLIDAIESGLVKIPQLPVQDTTGAEIPAYFNVWKWIVEQKLTAGEKGGRRGQVKPEAVLRWAQQPIAQLAGLWREKFLEWGREASEGKRPTVPLSDLAAELHDVTTGRNSSQRK